jgi:hypothetical protein
MTRKQIEKRRSLVIAELSAMSRNGWENVTSADWKPYEIELLMLNRALGLE